MPRRRDDEYDDDEDEDDRPRRRPAPRARTKKADSSRLALILSLVVLGVLLLLGAGIGGWFLLRDRSKGAADPTSLPGVIAYWSFDEGGGRAEDLSGRSNAATLVNTRTGAGVKGSGISLDGRSDQYADVGAGPALNFGAGAHFTVAGWFRTNDLAGTILSFRHTNLPTQIEVLVRNGVLQGIVGDDTDTGGNAFVTGQAASDGQWHHFAMTRKGGLIELYLDGFLQGQMVAVQSGGPLTTNLRAIGCERRWAADNDMRWGRPGFIGDIDEVYVFDRALSGNEILRLARR